MDNNRLPFTDEELVDFGWNEIKDKLPQKKRRRAIWLWLPAAAIILGAFYFVGNENSFILEKNQVDFTKQTNKPALKSNNQKNTISNLESNEEELTQINENNTADRIEHNRAIKKPVVAKESVNSNTNQNYLPIPNVSNDQGDQIARLYTDSSPNSNDKFNTVKNYSQQSENQEYKRENIGDLIDNATPNLAIQQPKIPAITTDNVKNTVEENKKPVDEVTQQDALGPNQKPVEKETISIVEEPEPAESDEEQITVDIEHSSTIEKKQGKNNQIKPFIGAELLTNEFNSYGGQLQTGVSYQLSDNQSLNLSIQVGGMQENLSRFSVFSSPQSLATPVSRSGSAEKNMDYEVVLIEMPLTYEHKVSNKISLSGGIIANYSNFTDLFNSNNQTQEQFVVQSDQAPNQNNLNTTAQSNFYVISDEFVEQFNQLSLGANAGLSYQIKPNLQLSTSSSFGFEVLRQKQFMDYQPSFFQIGGKYFITLNKKDK